MNPVDNLLAIAHELADSDPLASITLERAILASIHISGQNPGAKKFEDQVGQMVAVLKSMSQDLSDGIQEFAGQEDDVALLVKFFTDVIEAEQQQLESLSEKTKSLKTASRLMARTAGPLDFVKNLFKKKDPKLDEDEGAVHPSYTMDDSTSDDFVEGKSDWPDASHFIEQEFNENKEFFNGVDDILKQIDGARKKPSKKLMEVLKKRVDQLVRLGENLVKGIRKHLLEPATKVEITDEGLNSKPAPSGPGKMSPEKLENTVHHYTDMLKESLGDEKKTLQFLKELFSAVGPLIEDDRASIAAKKILPVLVRTAHSTPRSRLILMPVIRRIVSSAQVSK